MAAPIPFRKMNGLGNEFLVFDARERPVHLDSSAVMALGQPDSIGFDQMITIERSGRGADAFMRIHNRDGGEVDACGNATRCVGWLLMDETGRKTASIETNAGFLRAFDTGTPTAITVDMGTPRFRWDQIPLAEEFHDTRAIELQVGPIDAPILHSPSVASMGNRMRSSGWTMSRPTTSSASGRCSKITRYSERANICSPTSPRPMR